MEHRPVDDFERLSAALARAPSDIGVFASILREGRREGRSFESAWYAAIRAIMPPRTASSADYRREVSETRALLRESKPWMRAAYEGGEVTVTEAERVARLTEKRLDALMLSVQ
jgi:hypothetical protein